MAPDQGLHSLPLIEKFLDRLTGSKMVLFKFKDKYGKELTCRNIYDKCFMPQ